MRREWSVGVALVALGVVLAMSAPGYFSAGNARDMFLVNMPILVIAIGTTLVILSGEIDISVGSAFAVCSVVAGVVAKAGLPVAAAGAAARRASACRRRDRTARRSSCRYRSAPPR